VSFDIRTVRDINIGLCQYDWPFLRDARHEIDSFWQDLAARKPHVYDGRVLLMHEYEWRADAFHGLAFETSYSAFMTWKRLGFPDARVTNFFGMAALRTQDGAFLLGEMGPHTANAGQSYFPAGTPEPADVTGTRVDLAASVTRECLEETGLALSDLDLRDQWTAVVTHGQVAFMRDLRLSMDAQHAKRRIEDNLAREEAPELSRIHIVRVPQDAHGLTMPPFMQPFLDYAFA
jgi:8-oxo-dGTP pyrophosphatase MutT (NUDIX family)